MYFEEGERYGAIIRSDNGAISVAGFGTYVGRSVPKEAVSTTADPFKTAKVPCAKIELDDGNSFYACEGYVDFEEVIKLKIEIWRLNGKTINFVNINEIRKANS